MGRDLVLPFDDEPLRGAAMKRFALLPVVVACGLGACERHDFEGSTGTRQLHEHNAHDSHTGDAADHTEAKGAGHGGGAAGSEGGGKAH